MKIAMVPAYALTIHKTQALSIKHVVKLFKSGAIMIVYFCSSLSALLGAFLDWPTTPPDFVSNALSREHPSD